VISDFYFNWEQKAFASTSTTIEEHYSRCNNRENLQADAELFEEMMKETKFKLCGCCDEEGPPSEFCAIPRGEPTDFFWQRLRFAGFQKARAQMFMDTAGTFYGGQMEEELDEFGLLRGSEDICKSCLKQFPGKKKPLWLG